MSEGFVVLVPVKSPRAGKSRLVGVADRAGLAAAFATDMLQACLDTSGVEQVLVVTDDADFAASLSSTRAVTMADEADGLNPALRAAAAEAARRWPDLRPVAVLADLPALRPIDLATALRRITTSAAHFVSDAEGTGTVLYSAPSTAFEPRYGAGSAQAHRDAGAQEITGELASLRRDVDDLGSLHQAVALGVGPATTVMLG